MVYILHQIIPLRMIEYCCIHESSPCNHVLVTPALQEHLHYNPVVLFSREHFVICLLVSRALTVGKTMVPGNNFANNYEDYEVPRYSKEQKRNTY